MTDTALKDAARALLKTMETPRTRKATVAWDRLRAVVDPPSPQSLLEGLPLTGALWWFIENVGEDHPHRTELFFYLRQRVREEAAA